MRKTYIAIIVGLVLLLGTWSYIQSANNIYSTAAQKTLEGLLTSTGTLGNATFTGTTGLTLSGAGSALTLQNSETIKNSTDRRIMFGSDTTTTGIFGLILDAGSTGTVDIDVCIYFSDDGTDTAHSICWDDGADRFQFNGQIYLSAVSLQIEDDYAVVMGSSGDAVMRWETNDANANELILYMPEGGATNVPVFVIGDASIDNADLGFFNGVTDPSIAIISDDASDYVRLSVTDAGLIQLNSSVTSVSSSTTNSVTNKIVIEVNGTSYYLLASTSGT